ncbi:MAG: cystathionine gamma-synthase family protein [Longimicrobiales bacterium]|nr:cystathionine gamma-synthase family protein [Longimicrobiales bacterium]
MWDKDSKKKIGDRDLKPESLMMSYGYRPEWSEGAVKAPIFATSTFVFKSAEDGKAFFARAYGLTEADPDDETGLIYSRLNNPSLEILEDRLTLWDGAESAAVFESGMAAISTTALTFLRPGDLVVFSEPSYGGTEHLFHQILPQFHIRVKCFRSSDGEEGLRRVLEEEDNKERLRMIFVETPSNPTNDLVDIQACARVARECSTETRKVILAVDNTFLGPVFQHPLKHGADLVIYSLTKYVGGHSDLIAGAVLGSREDVDAVKGTRTFFGNIPGAFTGFLLMRSLETLKVRMVQETENARKMADFLTRHPKVAKVSYLGLLKEGDQGFDIFQRHCTGAGSMIAFEVHGGEAEAFRFLNGLKLIKLAVSLGGTESLAEHPGAMTHSDIPAEDQLKVGITPAMVRISVGLEDPDDLIADVAQALERV